MTTDMLSDVPRRPLAPTDAPGDSATAPGDDANAADWRPAVAAALLAALLLAVTINGTYVYDDVHVILLDPRVHDPALWSQFWTRPYAPQAVDNLYRPLVSTSYAVQWWLHGDRPWAFHLVNLLLHAAASAVVAELGRRLGGTRVAYIAGLLFAAHPVHVEAVANLVGRAELMCTAATVTALVLFAGKGAVSPFSWRGGGILLCFAVAVLSKEQGLLLPLILMSWAGARWLCDRGHGRREHRRREHRRREHRPAVALIATMWLLLCGYLALRESLFTFSWDRSQLDWTLNPMIRAQGVHRWLLMPLVLLGRYTSLLAAPVRLSPDYGGEIIGWVARARDPFLWIGAAALLGWCGAMWIAVRKRAAVLVALLLALALTYGMVSNVIIIGINLGERLMYLPSAFVVLLIAMAVARMRLGTATAIVGVALTLASARTVTYAARWNDRLGFYFACLEEQPHSARLHLLLADEAARRGDVPTADAVMASARQSMPEYWIVWVQSAQMATDRGELEKAVEYMNRAVAIDPTQTRYINQLAENIQARHAELRTAQVDLE